MKVYLAGEAFAGDIQTRIKRRLFSYWYHHKGDRPSEEVLTASDHYKLDMFLDSGAFTAFTQKVEIKIEDYAAYYHNVKERFSVCSSLDAVGDAAKSYANLKALESLGCKVQPVFHAREDVSWLIKYIEEGYDYIFIGGMVPESTSWLLKWLDTLFTHYLTNPDGTAKVRLHGFGLTTEALIFRYPWFSVDSTSWLAHGRFGSCLFPINGKYTRILFSGQHSTAKKWSTLYYKNLPKEFRTVVDAALLKYGFTAEQCESSYLFRNEVNAQTFQEMELLARPVFKHHEVGLW